MWVRERRQSHRDGGGVDGEGAEGLLRESEGVATGNTNLRGGQVSSDDGERSDDGLALNHDSAVTAGNHHFNGSGGVVGQCQHGGIIRVVEERELHG